MSEILQGGGTWIKVTAESDWDARLSSVVVADICSPPRVWEIPANSPFSFWLKTDLPLSFINNLARNACFEQCGLD